MKSLKIKLRNINLLENIWNILFKEFEIDHNSILFCDLGSYEANINYRSCSCYLCEIEKVLNQHLRVKE